MEHVYDAVVVGTGIAGLSAAIMLKEYGHDVVVLSKADEAKDTATNLAQGGIIAWHETDTSRLLEADILRAGCGHNQLNGSYGH